MLQPLKNNILSIQVKHSKIGLLNRKIGQPDTNLSMNDLGEKRSYAKLSGREKNAKTGPQSEWLLPLPLTTAAVNR